MGHIYINGSGYIEIKNKKTGFFLQFIFSRWWVCYALVVGLHQCFFFLSLGLLRKRKWFSISIQQHYLCTYIPTFFDDTSLKWNRVQHLSQNRYKISTCLLISCLKMLKFIVGSQRNCKWWWDDDDENQFLILFLHMNIFSVVMHII